MKKQQRSCIHLRWIFTMIVEKEAHSITLFEQCYTYA